MTISCCSGVQPAINGWTYHQCAVECGLPLMCGLITSVTLSEQTLCVHLSAKQLTNTVVGRRSNLVGVARAEPLEVVKCWC